VLTCFFFSKLAEIASAVQAQDEAALEAALNKFYPAADEILANAKALADRLQDPVKKGMYCKNEMPSVPTM